MRRYYLGHGPLVPDDWGFGPAEPPEPDEPDQPDDDEPDECPDCLPRSECGACSDDRRYHEGRDAQIEDQL